MLFRECRRSPGACRRKSLLFRIPAEPCLHERVGQNDERDKVMTNNSEEIRLRYLYRKLILEGKAVLSFESAKKLIGPDCAFHLYSIIDSKTIKKKTLMLPGSE